MNVWQVCGHGHECLILVSIEEKSCCVSQVKGQTNATRPGRPDLNLKVEGGFLWTNFQVDNVPFFVFFSEDAFFRKCIGLFFFAFCFFLFFLGGFKNGPSD